MSWRAPLLAGWLLRGQNPPYFHGELYRTPEIARIPTDPTTKSKLASWKGRLPIDSKPPNGGLNSQAVASAIGHERSAYLIGLLDTPESQTLMILGILLARHHVAVS